MTDTHPGSETQHLSETRPIRPAKLAHIVLRSPRFAACVAWWTNVLGAEATFESESATFLTFDDEHHRVAIFDAPHLDDNEGSTAGLEHVAFTYEHLDDLLATYRRLKADGITPFAPIHHGITLSLYYLDPDRNQVELQVDAMTLAQATQFMTGDVFASNPGGVLFDPDDLIARRAEGESISSLLAYAPS